MTEKKLCQVKKLELKKLNRQLNLNYVLLSVFYKMSTQILNCH